MKIPLSDNDMRRIKEIAKYQGYKGSKEGKTLSQAEIETIVSEAIIVLYVQEKHKNKN